MAIVVSERRCGSLESGYRVTVRSSFTTYVSKDLRGILPGVISVGESRLCRRICVLADNSVGHRRMAPFTCVLYESVCEFGALVKGGTPAAVVVVSGRARTICNRFGSIRLCRCRGGRGARSKARRWAGRFFEQRCCEKHEHF